MSSSLPETYATETPSGFRRLVGYRLAAWRDGYAEVELELDGRHLNRSDIVHGGVYVTLIDAAGGYAGCYCTVPGNVRRAFTLSLSTNFVGNAASGRLRAIARKTGGGRRVFFASMEVVDGDGRVVATGEGVYRYRRGSESPEGTPLEAHKRR
jgi:uncharacterized protein (TIGR00369 family)